MKKLGLLLIIVAVEAQIIFPGEDGSFPVRSDSPTPVEIKTTDRNNKPTGLFFPDTPISPPRSSTGAIPDSSGIFSKPELTATAPSVFPSECGEVLVQRVVGGEISAPGEWPWLAAVGTKRRSTFTNQCGGALITRHHVVSAQHCFQNEAFAPNTVRLGEYDLTRTDDVPFGVTQDFAITQRLIKDYNPTSLENDIVILVLDGEVKLSEYVQPVCLPFNYRNDDFSDKFLAVAGWGKTDFKTDSFSDVVQYVLLPVVNTSRCADSYSHSQGSIQPVIDDRNLCAGNGTKDSCSGDSGGPLHYLSLSDGRYYLTGIVSFGSGCGDPDYPGVYTRITRFLDWITRNVQDSQN
ncbi:venom protease-like [Eriocheir sinensis]|uniref:venom protease-like n=1 Tax=Eriocheir sinensis TaxID=95602 RepID=UPI0021C7AC65|nr:venom protease-like [Eriocheir sinensis]XP_050711429.1 venom protease-like [Eriocheir sinensis]